MTVNTLRALLRFLWRDLRGSQRMRSLWVFAASLILGIALVSACSGLLQLVQGSFQTQQRFLFGGDLQVSQRSPVSDTQLRWMNDNADVSRLLELRTMMGTESGEFTVVELQSVDDAYPLYGAVTLQPEQSLQEAVGLSADGEWGAAFDPVLAEQLELSVGDRVSIGTVHLELRALIIEQPDRSLRADVRGPPLIIDQHALASSGLMQPTSLIDYEYRIRTPETPSLWRDRLRASFPEAQWEVQTVDERGDLVSERLDQVGSVLLLVGFSTLFIGGLGVANSIGAYLQTKLATLATLQSLGSHDAHVALVFIGQVTALGMMASSAGALLGSAVAWFSALYLSQQLPIDMRWTGLLPSTLLSILFGCLTALLFSLPVLGRSLSIPTARLIRGLQDDNRSMPVRYVMAMVLTLLTLLGLLLLLIPEPRIALAFIVALTGMTGFLQLVVAIIRKSAQRLSHHSRLDGRFALRLACASLSGKHTSLRPMLLSLGTALTLLVAATLIIAATAHALTSTVPERAPALVLYDLQEADRPAFQSLVRSLDGFQDLVIAPLVLGRLTRVNDEWLQHSDVAQRALEANDEQKLSYRQAGIDNTRVDRGSWWPDDYAGPPLVAMEDREADQLGLQVGDRLVFTIQGQELAATLAAIYSQARFETSFWLEAVFSPAVLDPFISRNIGSVQLDSGTDGAAVSAISTEFPSVVLVRTTRIIEAARSVLHNASLGILAIAIVSLSASILVMASVVAVNRQRQIFEASVLHALGTRLRVILTAVSYEYAMLAVLLTLFATLFGSLIGYLALEFWLKLPTIEVWFSGLLVAILASFLCLTAGALWLVRSLSVSPAMLLRSGAG
ncbi:MAG: FtsX-like permease family protein [Granulosicoccus sp.]|nr:FtsX-like permease family protein [Granulosicoccus sp.]